MNKLSQRTQIFNFLIGLGFVLIIIIKFYLTRKYEIVAIGSDPESYLARAAFNIWSDKVGIGALGHPPGYSIFVWLVNLSGIPLRIFHEIFYILSTGFLVYCLRFLKIPKLICLGVFAVMVFYPLTFRFFNDARSESSVISLFNFLVGVTILLLISRKKSSKLVYSCLSGLILGMIAITRPEREVFYLYFLGFGLITWITGYRISRNQKIEKIIYYCLIPFLLFCLVNFSCTVLNKVNFGVSGVSLFDSPSYKGMYTKLMKIDVGTPQRYIPFTQAQLAAAYEVSPTLKKMQPFLPKEEIIQSHGLWLLIYAAREVSSDRKAQSVYQVFTEVNKELEKAFQEKVLPSKPLLLGYLDPNIGVWLPHVKSSFIKVVNWFIFPPMSEVENILAKDDPKASVALFNATANRRAALINNHNPNSKIFTKVKILNYLVYVLNVLGIISFVILLIYYCVYQAKSLFLSTYIIIVFLILLTQIARLLLYSLLDASAWEIPMRYLFPSMPLFSGLSLLNIFVVFNLLSKKILKMKN